jgi:hypothetical protein
MMSFVARSPDIITSHHSKNLKILVSSEGIPIVPG